MAQYSKLFTDALEFMWGEGFLSPGGPEDVAALLGTVSLKGRRVLDIGSGLGGIDVLLVAAHGAAEVIGIDVEDELIEAASARIAQQGLSHRIVCQLVKPGPLPFAPASFDVVFSKDSIVHIPDKLALYRDVRQVLKPQGHFLASDWLFCDGAATHPALVSWLAVSGLRFQCMTPEETKAALQSAGFVDVSVIDRNANLRQSNVKEVEALSGPARERLAAIVGAEMAQKRLESALGRQKVLDLGILRPCHIRASSAQGAFD